MRDEYKTENRETISGQVKNRKFQYQKDPTDWGIVFVVVVTTLLFSAIFFGGRYFEGYREIRTPDDSNRIQQLIDGEKNLIQELEQYEIDQDFNDSNDN